MISEFIEVFLHVDKYLAVLAGDYGAYMYVLLFLIIFAETGLVIAPFLPGDSLLFAAGALAASGVFNISILIIIITLAAIIGDSLNYSVGKFIGPKIFRKEKGLFFNKNHLITTQKFYEKYGSKTIILARFVPIVRTFAPFVAGIGKMKYSKFMVYNVTGGILWAFIFLIAGYLFGNIPLVKDNFGFVIIGIIFISIIPMIFPLVKKLFKK